MVFSPIDMLFLFNNDIFILIKNVLLFYLDKSYRLFVMLISGYFIVLVAILKRFPSDIKLLFSVLLMATILNSFIYLLVCVFSCLFLRFLGQTVMPSGTLLQHFYLHFIVLITLTSAFKREISTVHTHRRDPCAFELKLLTLKWQ